jgi:hypothetical protein
VAEALDVAPVEQRARARSRHLVVVERLVEERHDRITGGVQDGDRHAGIAGRLEAAQHGAGGRAGGEPGHGGVERRVIG